jgi:hypothetical protein
VDGDRAADYGKGEWDAMNYELGTDLQNMLQTETGEFFTRLKSYFK